MPPARPALVLFSIIGDSSPACSNVHCNDAATTLNAAQESR